MSEHPTIRLYEGSMLDRLKELPDCSIDICLTDPPYGLGQVKDIHGMIRDWLDGGDGREFQGKSGFKSASWDSGCPPPSHWREAYRVLKPGGWVMAFASSRTYHYMALSIELAGFKPHPAIWWMGWVYGEGMPKSMNLGKAIDRQQPGFVNPTAQERVDRGIDITSPVTPAGLEWEGWYAGSQSLKPCYEPILIFQKPFEGPSVASIQKWNVGAMNLDLLRVGDGGKQQQFSISAENSGMLAFGKQKAPYHKQDGLGLGYNKQIKPSRTYMGMADVGKPKMSLNKTDNPVPMLEGVVYHVSSMKAGRLPSNIILSHSPFCKIVGERVEQVSAATEFTDEDQGDGFGFKGRVLDTYDQTVPVWECVASCPVGLLEEQTKDKKGHGKSHFFSQANFTPEDFSFFKYVIKPKEREKNEGVEDGENLHLTVKPVALFEWLIKLVARPGAVILDPYMGSGTTMVAVARLQKALDLRGIGCELEHPSFGTACQRVLHATSVELHPKDAPVTVAQPKPRLRQFGLDFDATDDAGDNEEIEVTAAALPQDATALPQAEAASSEPEAEDGFWLAHDPADAPQPALVVTTTEILPDLEELLAAKQIDLFQELR